MRPSPESDKRSADESFNKLPSVVHAAVSDTESRGMASIWIWKDKRQITINVQTNSWETLASKNDPKSEKTSKMVRS